MAELGLRCRYPWQARAGWREKPAGTFRIAAVGDSFTWGHGVMADDTWVARLEHLLNRSGRDHRVEALNFAIRGQNAFQTLRVLRDFAFDSAPDIVIYRFYLNDPEPSRFVPPG